MPSPLRSRPTFERNRGRAKSALPLSAQQCPPFRSLSGVKRTSHVAPHMSASDPKRTWPLVQLDDDPARINASTRSPLSTNRSDAELLQQGRRPLMTHSSAARPFTVRLYRRLKPIFRAGAFP